MQNKTNIHKGENDPDDSSAFDTSAEEEQAGNNNKYQSDHRDLKRSLELFKIQTHQGYGGNEYKDADDQ